jgi:hypothetical protein
VSISEAKPWFTQATSNLHAAEALRNQPSPMLPEDVGCHVAAMCAQTIEKSIKGYVIVNGASPSLDHRPDKYLQQLLAKDNPLLRHKDHHGHLSKLFDPATRKAVRTLLDLTPGGQGNRRTDVPNTEYPWKVNGTWGGTPVGYSNFGGNSPDAWFKLAKRILDTLKKLSIAAQHSPGL